LPGKCYAQGEYSDEYIQSLLVTVRPAGGLGMQIVFVRTAKAKSATGKGTGPGTPGGPPNWSRLLRELLDQLEKDPKSLRYQVVEDLLRAETGPGVPNKVGGGTTYYVNKADIFRLSPGYPGVDPANVHSGPYVYVSKTGKRYPLLGNTAPWSP
jgi:hypothetical protein